NPAGNTRFAPWPSYGQEQHAFARRRKTRAHDFDEALADTRLFRGKRFDLAPRIAYEAGVDDRLCRERVALHRVKPDEISGEEEFADMAATVRQHLAASHRAFQDLEIEFGGIA